MDSVAQSSRKAFFKMASIRNLISAIFFILSMRKADAYLEYIAARLPLEGTRSPPGSPWPLPQERTSLPELITIPAKDNYAYFVNVENCKPLEVAFQTRFKYEVIFRDSTQPDETFPALTRIEIALPQGLENECSEHPRLIEDSSVGYENYNLTVSSDGTVGTVKIVANTVWGALHGLETYSHLIWEGDNQYFYLNLTEIQDWPRYPHRGMMIDTARHYLYPETIFKILDGMAYNKLNVLHWHVVDDQSFPFVSVRFPDLSTKGAYRADRFIYDPDTVQEIIEEARLRGIRVILEFDTPGHTQGFGKAYPELLTPCYGEGTDSPGTPEYPNHAAFEILDPTKEFTFTFMKDFFTEVVSVSKDQFVHLGMDEVYYKCWESSPVVAEFMAAHNFTEISQVQQYYTERHLDMVKGLGARSIVWNDPLEYNVEMEKDVIVQVWKGGATDWVKYFKDALDKGYKVLLSSCWYLNYIEYGQTWRNYYACDPVMNLTEQGEPLTSQQEGQILGGEAAIWSEYVDDTNILPRFFPFVSAVAEKLWSRMNVSSADDAMWRLDEHRCRMLWRGLPAQPILNGYCDPR